MKNINYSKEHIEYLKNIKKNNNIIVVSRILILIVFIFLWEIFAKFNVIDSFITSCPSKIIYTIYDLFVNDNLSYHIIVTLYETILGFLLAVILGYFISIILWWSERLRKILEPYLIVLNSLPKIALGPIIIIWCGSGQKAIIFMAIIICIIVAIMTMLSGFLETDKDKIILLKTMGATKLQILLKVVIPSSIPTFISMLKINVGMAWIGSIMGEYLVSKAVIGYLIVYGSQVFKLDLVMASTTILCVLASLMYFIISFIEKKICIKKQ